MLCKSGGAWKLFLKCVLSRLIVHPAEDCYVNEGGRQFLRRFPNNENPSSSSNYKDYAHVRLEAGVRDRFLIRVSKASQKHRQNLPLCSIGPWQSLLQSPLDIAGGASVATGVCSDGYRIRTSLETSHSSFSWI